jgi:hypothetical protein
MIIKKRNPMMKIRSRNRKKSELSKRKVALIHKIAPKTNGLKRLCITRLQNCKDCNSQF